MPRLSVPLTDAQHQAIRAKATQTGIPLAEAARRFLLAWARGEIKLPERITVDDIYRLLAGSPSSPNKFDGLAEIIDDDLLDE